MRSLTLSIKILFLLCFLCFSAFNANAEEWSGRTIFDTPDEQDDFDFSFTWNKYWHELDEGIDFTRVGVSYSIDRYGELFVVRINPQKCDIFVLTASAEGETSHSLQGWAEKYHLVSAINAGMYKSDGLTHTGYLRSGATINNEHIAKKFGAFFVASPDTPELPNASVLDRTSCDWESLLPHYAYAVQNFRMLSDDRRVQWDASGPEHIISAVAEDGAKNILFLHFNRAISCAEFAQMLPDLPLDIHQTMYVEGGSPAGLYIDTRNEDFIWTKNSAPHFWSPNKGSFAIPNVIGVRPKN